MKAAIYISLLLVLLGTGACKKYLDVTPDNVATLNSAFANANEAQAYLFGCYSSLQALSDVIRNPGFTSSGEVILPINLPGNGSFTNAGQDAGFNMMRGLQNADNPLMNYWDGYNWGLNLWQTIRKCNTFLANINTPPDLPKYQKTRWIAEANFLKAYYHYWLIRLYGPIPIEDVALPVDATEDQVREKQQPVDSCFSYVINTLDKAIPDLPASIENVAAESGRITATIALAVKAEVLATMASPLFNGNPDYASFKGKDGKNLFSTAADPSKWQRAATACKAAIDAAGATGVQLYQFVPQGNIVHMSDSTRALLTLQGAVTDSWNPEQIWTLNPQFGYQYVTAPRVNSEATLVYDFFSNFSVPQAEADLFYTNNGIPINEDKTWDYQNRNAIVPGDAANRFYVKQGYQTNQGNLNRERRYYADVAFDGSTWFGFSITDDTNPNYINAVNGSASPEDNISYNATGYWAKKLVPYQTAVANSNLVTQPYSWPFMRLPQLWLLYAECLNETSGPGGDAYTYIDKVRARAGLQGVQQSWSQYSKNPNKPNTQDGLRQIIHQETRIELAFEGQAGWDLRRWKELQGVLVNPFQGWNVFGKTSASYYKPTTVYQPLFSLKDYFVPVQTYDLTINPNLIQTPYW